MAKRYVTDEQINEFRVASVEQGDAFAIKQCDAALAGKKSALRWCDQFVAGFLFVRAIESAKRGADRG